MARGIWKADGAPEAGVLAILLEDAQDKAGLLDDDALGLVGVQRALSMK